MKIIIVLGNLVSWTVGTQVAIDLWRSLGGALIVDHLLTDQSLTESLRARKMLSPIQKARLLFTEIPKCSETSLRSLFGNDDIHAMCRHVRDYHLIYAKLGNERLAQYVAHALAGRPMDAALLTYFTPLANLDIICGFSFNRMPLDMVQVLMRSNMVVRMSRGIEDTQTNIEVSSVGDILKYSISELYFHTTNPKSLISLFDLVEAQLATAGSIESSIRLAVGRLAGLSVAHAIPMGDALSHKVSILADMGDAVNEGMNEVVPDLWAFPSRFELLAGIEPITVPYDAVIESLVSDISETGVFFAEYLRGDDQLGKAQLRIESFLRESTGLRNLPIGGLAVLIPAITLKVVPLETADQSPSFDPVTQTVRLPAYPTAEQLFQSLDKYFHL